MSTSKKLKENIIEVYFADKKEAEKIELPKIGFPIDFAYPGYSDSELILVVKTETSIELIRWDFRDEQEVKKYVIPETDYQIPHFSSDRKYVAMFDYNHGILLMNLETGDIAHIIDTYETSLRYAPLYTSVFWSWDSETLYIISRSNLYSIRMDEIESEK